MENPVEDTRGYDGEGNGPVVDEAEAPRWNGSPTYGDRVERVASHVLAAIVGAAAAGPAGLPKMSDPRDYYAERLASSDAVDAALTFAIALVNRIDDEVLEAAEREAEALEQRRRP